MYKSSVLHKSNFCFWVAGTSRQYIVSQYSVVSENHIISHLLLWATCLSQIVWVWLNHFYVIGLKPTAFGKITQNYSRYAVHGHLRSQILVSIKSPYATSYVNNCYLHPVLHCFLDWRIIGQIFGIDSCLCLTHSFSLNPYTQDCDI